jgi:hypothetical protein
VDTGGYQKSGTSSMKRVTVLEGISQIVSEFIEASRNLDLDFLHKETYKNYENHQRSIKKKLFRFLGP